MTKMDEKLIKVTLPDGREFDVASGTLLFDFVYEIYKEDYLSILAAKVNNDIKELSFELTSDCNVEFVDLFNMDGMRIYRRSLCFVLIKAVHDIFPDRRVIINHSISKGLYCEVRGEKQLTEAEVAQIKKRMKSLIDRKIPFNKSTAPLETSKGKFKKFGRLDWYNAVAHRDKPHITMYECDGFYDYFYGYMVPDTGYIRLFDLKFYAPGLILLFPERKCPDKIPDFFEQRKLFNIYTEYKRWLNILKIDNISALNDTVKSGEINDLIKVAEALHEKKIAQIADLISNSPEKKRVILIAGPSSSGKTTFANRLSIQLRVNGLKPVTLSLDDYFINRENTPKDEFGEFDYESIDAIDVKLFNEQLLALLNGEEVETPVYNFTKGEREKQGAKRIIDKSQLLIIEGIHGLNEKLTFSIPRENKFKIYVSALTSLNLDDHNRIPTTDTRIFRRIVRDNQFRGTNALSTIKRWPSVRRGEEKNIFPYQEESDVMFNSSLVFELGVLKKLVEPLLAEIDNSNPEYSEAKRLLEFSRYFLPVPSNEIPMNSIIREFIGGSCFYY